MEEEIETYCSDSKLDYYLKLEQEAKAFFKSKAVCGMHLALSFLNLI